MLKLKRLFNKEAARKSFHRIKTLLNIQSKDKIRALKGRSKRAIVARVSLAAAGFGLITYAFFALFGYASGTFKFPFDVNFLATVLFLTQVIAVLSCMSSTIELLYSNKENTLLLAFPCKVSEVFTSKLIIFLVNEIKRSIFFTLPFMIAFGAVSTGTNWAYWVLLPIAWLILVMLPPLFATFFSVAVLYIKKFLHNHALLYTITLVGFFALCFYACYAVLGKLPTPIRIVAMYGKFIETISQWTADVAAVANIYTLIGKMMFGQRVYLYLPISLLIVVAFTALVYLSVMPFYFKAVSSTAENVSKKVHKPSKREPHTIYGTFLRKEWLLMTRDTSRINSIITIWMLIPIILYILNFILQAISKNILGEYIVVAFNMMIILTLLATYNSSQAAVFSSEGLEFAVLKTAPAKTMNIGWAKMTVAAAVDCISLIFAMVLLTFITDVSDGNLALMFLAMLLASLAHILWSCQLDLNNPKFADYAAKGGAVTDNKNIAKAMFIGFLIGTLYGVITLLIMMDNFSTSWVRIVLLSAGLFLARLYLYYANMKVYYRDMEM